MEQTSYVTIAKGRGYLYAHDNQLYRQTKKRGSVVYVKCCMEPCDGSAKIESGEFKLNVSVHFVMRYYYLSHIHCVPKERSHLFL